MDNVTKQRKFLEKILNEDELNIVTIAPFSNKVLVSDPETFQKIASKIKFPQIKITGDRVHFNYDLLGLNKSQHDWRYELIKGKETFLNKYGSKYFHQYNPESLRA